MRDEGASRHCTSSACTIMTRSGLVNEWLTGITCGSHPAQGAPMKRTAAALGLLLACVAPVRSQAGDPGKRLLADPAVRKALDWVKHNEPSILEEQVRLCEIPAPPFKERERGEAYRQLFEKLGLKDVRIDAAGNVLGERPGRAARPHLVFTAHLDTVFPEGTV